MSFLAQFEHQLFGPEQGRKWVFLHGLMGFANNWRKIVSQLEATERILVYDQRGHGKSFKPADGYRPEDYSDDLYRILEELGWSKIILVGHSMGGRNALNFAFRFPEKIERLVIEDIGPDANKEAGIRLENLVNLVPTPFVSREEAKKFFQGEFLLKAKSATDLRTLANFFYANMLERPDGLVDWRFSKQAILLSIREGREHDRWNEWESLQCPTLLIRGEKSQDLTHEVFLEMKRRLPKVKAIEIPNAGHWVHFEQANKFVEVLRDFVSGSFDGF